MEVDVVTIRDEVARQDREINALIKLLEEKTTQSAVKPSSPAISLTAFSAIRRASGKMSV
jgi:hypothetical protein